MPLTPEQLSIRGKIAAHESWSRTPDRAARTANARRAALGRFEVEVLADAIARGEIAPGGSLPADECARRAEHKRTAHFQRLALRSAQARARRKGGAA